MEASSSTRSFLLQTAYCKFIFLSGYSLELPLSVCALGRFMFIVRTHSSNFRCAVVRV